MERDNGLEADTFVFLGTVDTSRSEELLDDLAAEGIAAYAVAAEPGERLYVDRGSLGYAQALLRRSGAEVDDDTAEIGDATAAAGDTEADTDSDDDGDTADDTAFERIVAGYDRADDDGDEERPWPDAEDLADADDDGDSDDDTDGTDDERTVGKNKARVSVIRLDTDDAEAEEDEDHYVRPDPPALPKGDIWTKGAWVVMLAALAYPILGLVLEWHMPGWSIALAVVAFVAGIVTHVMRLRNPHAGDDSDNGAVV